MPFDQAMKDHELLKLIQAYSYLGMFIWFALVQLIFPIPQEIALISIGYVSTHIDIDIFLSIGASAVGITVSDMILFYLSRSGNKITQSLIAKFNTSWRKRVESNIDSDTVKTIFILLMLPEARMIAPLIAGIAGITAKHFVLIDLIANLFLSIVYTLLGKFFYTTLQKIGGAFRPYDHFIFIGIMLIAAVLLFVFIRRKYMKGSK